VAMRYDYDGYGYKYIDSGSGSDWQTRIKDAEPIYAIQPAAQPAQEPVAWGYRSKDGEICDCISPEAHADAEGDYTVPLYTTPPQRPWVGLTDEERHYIALVIEVFGLSVTEILLEAEAKLKEKNT